VADCVKRYNIYAPTQSNIGLEYDIIDDNNIQDIIYNTPKTASPLKLFYLPVKENVVKETNLKLVNIIIGAPSCDLAALDILDEIYLNEPFIDPFYKKRRENSIIIGTDCYSIEENCHCNVYDVKAIPEKNHDILLSFIDERIFLSINSDKGSTLLKNIRDFADVVTMTEDLKNLIESKRETVASALKKQNRKIPAYSETGNIINESDDAIWKEFSRTCVSCGACSTICPTCTCFLLVDRSGFEKIRQMDACQFPGFARIAAGEDNLGERHVRFKNRYLCKYVWKPQKFKSLACTGCGRCIDTCIGGISKNKLFIELANQVTA